MLVHPVVPLNMSARMSLMDALKKKPGVTKKRRRKKKKGKARPAGDSIIDKLQLSSEVNRVWTKGSAVIFLGSVVAARSLPWLQKEG